MRHRLYVLYLFLSLFTLVNLQGCSTLNLPEPQTAAQQLAAGYATISSLRSLATAGLQQKLISVEDAKFVLAQTDLARVALDAARVELKTDVKSSFDKINATSRILNEVQRYLALKGVK